MTDDPLPVDPPTAARLALLQARLHRRNLQTAGELGLLPPQVVTSEWATARIAELEAENAALQAELEAARGERK